MGQKNGPQIYWGELETKGIEGLTRMVLRRIEKEKDCLSH